MRREKEREEGKRERGGTKRERESEEGRKFPFLLNGRGEGKGIVSCRDVMTLWVHMGLTDNG